MTRRIVIIGAGMSEISYAALAALITARTGAAVAEFREANYAAPADLIMPSFTLMAAPAPAPKFGGGRAYLKKKKGRS